MPNMFNINEATAPDNQTYYEYYKVKEKGELFRIAKEKNINPNLLAILNGLDPTDYVYENQLLMIPNKNYTYYITKEGDTINTILHTLDTNINSLIKNNPTIYLHEGQLIVNRIK